MFRALRLDLIRQVRLRHLVIAAVLALPLAVFFAPTIIAGNAPGGFDLSYQSSPWRDATTRPLDAQSPVQIDQAEQLPWVDGMWESLRDGRVPMWTPAVGGGTSLGTNPVFTTYSVFTVVGELVGGATSLAIGLAVRVILATIVAELFAYLFLRRMRLSVGASVFGAVAYVFSGAAVAVETRNAIPLLLPVFLWCVDRLATRITPGRIVAVAVAVLALWLEGFPAMLVHAVVVGGTWWVVRTATQRGATVWRRPVFVSWFRSAAAFGGALALGLALSAFSAVPFALQLGYNDVFAARSDQASPLGRETVWWLLDERALGTPDRGPWYIALNPFEGVAAVGTLVMVLAVLGVLISAARRSGDGTTVRSAVRNYWAIMVAVLVIAIYLGGPILEALYALPGFSGNPFSRIRYVVAFGLAVLAAIGLDEIETLWQGRRGSEATELPSPVGAGDRLRPAWRSRVPHVVLAVAFVGCLASPFVLSLGTYLDIVRGVRELAIASWRNELVLLAVALVVGALALVSTRRLSERWAPWRTIGIGAFAAAIAFAQVGLQITRLTPQVDRAFYYPETTGYRALRKVAGHESRFIGSGMGTFAPNTAMTNDVVDARSHSFRDPQWKSLILAAFPDALGPDPLKINVDFHGNVVWNSPLLDDMSLGVIALSSSEVPLGDRAEAPPARSWDRVSGARDAALSDGPMGPYVGIDLRLRTTGDCAQGDVMVSGQRSDRDEPAVARRPLNDARAAGVAGTSLPFALPMDDATAGESSTITVALDGAPPDCVLEVGRSGADASDGSMAFGAITRPADASWELTSADGGWLYTRSSSHPLVRMVSDWTALSSRSKAVAAAVDPGRDGDGPMPVAFADSPSSSTTGGSVRSWSTDDHGLSATTASDGPSLLVASFNAAPGWSVTVDGAAADVVEPDGALLGVQVPAGRHRVRFEYFPPGLAAGSAITLVGVLAVVVILLWPRLGRRFGRRREPVEPLSPPD